VWQEIREPFWFLVKASMKRDKLLKEENISSRIGQACEEIHPSQLHNFAHHSKCQIINCFNKKKFKLLKALLLSKCD
jgi:hypothetical protein